MENSKIGFIGGGNMAASLIGGLLDGGAPAENIVVGEPNPDRQQWLEQKFGIAVTDNNADVIAQSDVVIMAVKPQQLKAVVEALAGALQTSKPLLISIAAGVRQTDMQRWAGGDLAIVRVMPNTPALVGAGAAGLYANGFVDDDQKALAQAILQAVGIAVWVTEESELDLVTAISGSGPAYFFFLMELMESAAVKHGMDIDQARLLTLETALGAAKLALLSDEGPAELRRKVTSPGGTTEAALTSMQEGKLPEIIELAICAATERSRELAKELGE
ncbi:MAG: pyrroline-5-carboxylate reductase [Gammaproteobacteria bacterium]|nr:MAG: pyrroline-5-carboxylate reductase [Gammaproteobacteria bacterium]